MIQANELRIGNLVYYNGKHNELGIVSEIKKFLIPDIEYVGLNNRIDCYYQTKHFKPIQLTEEILLKCKGFYKDNYKKESKNHSAFYSISHIDYKYSFAYADFRGDWGFYHSYTDAPNDDDNNKFDFISCGIKYLHQLQNLYFALTGEELEINL